MAQGIDSNHTMSVVFNGVPLMSEVISFQEPKIAQRTETVTTGSGSREVPVSFDPMNYSITLAGDKNLVEPKAAGGMLEDVTMVVTLTARSELNVVTVTSYEVKGKIKLIDNGDIKMGTLSEYTIEGTANYYKKTINGANVIEADAFLGKYQLGDKSLNVLLGGAAGLTLGKSLL